MAAYFFEYIFDDIIEVSEVVVGETEGVELGELGELVHILNGVVVEIESAEVGEFLQF